MFLLSQRAFFALCLIFLFACTTTTCRQWEIQEIITKTPSFNGGRLILGPNSDYSYLELELIRNRSGIRFYINILFLQAPPLQSDSTRTSMEIRFEEQEPWMIYPFLLEGGQRLLIPGDCADFLIQALINNHSFVMQIGRNQINVVPDNFFIAYERLLSLPIEEDVQKEPSS